MQFVNLYLETEYTLLGSSVKLDELMDYATSKGIDTLAITDLDNMHGVIKFYQKCTKNNIKPIIGMHLTLESKFNYYNSVLLYAKNNNGYKNLLKLSTMRKLSKEIYITDIYKYLSDIVVVLPSSEHELVKAYKEGSLEKIENILNEYKVLDDVYLGYDLQSEEAKYSIDAMLAYFESKGLSGVAINKTNYLFNDDFRVYKTLRCVSENIKDYNHSEKEQNSCFLNNERGRDLFRRYPALLDNTIKIANKCNVTIEFGKYKMPVYDSKINTESYLHDLAYAGLKKRLVSNNVNVNDYKKYIDRLNYELSIINKMGFNDYFLIVYDFIKYAKKERILVGPGRGSAPSSLVSYSLGITELDPLKYNLLFERFLNPERISMPDIDTDFPDNERSKVISYMGTRYGKKRVAHICTFGTYGPRLALRDVARVTELRQTYLDEILGFIGNNESIRDCLNNPIYKRMYDEDSDVKYVTDIVIRMENLPRNTSVHAAGIIMADSDLVDYTPLSEGIDGIYETQYEASDLESLGLVKIDFLGLKNLTTIDKVIKQTHKNINIYKIPLNDKETYNMLASGNTNGVFQLESSGMRSTLMKLKTSEFDDIVNALALYRPGPMEMIPSFINRKFKQERIDYLHNDLVDILKPTYGIIVYQEQILLIASKFAGYTLGEADVLRRAVSKKKMDVLEKEREKFVIGAVKKGYSKDLANQIFEYILKFANYGFNKSHSVAYSLVSYQMAYLKTHYFKEFMAVMMSDKIGSVASIKSYILECNKKNINVLPPSINKSSIDFVCIDNDIYYSLLGITGLGDTVLRNLLSERSQNGLYKSYDEFIRRTKDILNKKHVEMLINSGALDDFQITRKAMNEEYDQSLQIANLGEMFKEHLSDHIFGEEEYAYEEIARNEALALGFNLKFDILRRYEGIKRKYKTIEIANLNTNKTSLCVFIIKRIKEISTKKGDKMAFVSVYDNTSELECVIFPTVYKDVSNTLIVGNVYISELKTEVRNENMQGIINKIKQV